MTTDDDRSTHMAEQAEQYIHSLICEAVPKLMSLDEIRDASLTDATMQQLRVIIDSGRWNDNVGDHLRPYKHIFNELSTCVGIVLRQSRIVIPASLQQRVVDLSHQGHQQRLMQSLTSRNKSTSSKQSLLSWYRQNGRRHSETMYRLPS